MSGLIDATALDRGIDQMLKCFTVDQARVIVEYRADSELQRRIEVLAELSNEGNLTPDDQAV